MHFVCRLSFKRTVNTVYVHVPHMQEDLVEPASAREMLKPCTTWVYDIVVTCFWCGSNGHD